MKPPPANALVNKLLALTLLLLVFAGTLGLGAVWVRQEIFQTANRSRVLQNRIDIFHFKIGHLVEDLLLRQARTEKIQNIRHTNSHSTNARTPTTLVWIYGYSLARIHTPILHPI